MRLDRRARAGGAIALAFAAVLGARAVAHRVVRLRASAAAERRHLQITAGKVAIGWFSVELADVDVRPEGTEFGSAHVAELRVGLGVLLDLTDVAAIDVSVHLQGTPDELGSQLSDWWRHRSSATAGTSVVPVSVDGITFDWIERQGQESTAHVEGGSVRRRSAGWELAARSIVARRGTFSIEGHDGNVAFADGRLRSARIGHATCGWGPAPSTTGMQTATEGPEADPASASAPKLLASTPAPSGKDDSTRPPISVPLPDLGALHGRFVGFAAILRDRVAEGASLDVDSLSFELTQGGRHFKVGQGPLSAARQQGTFVVDFRTRPNATGTPLEVQASLPLEAGEATVTLAGGPISLSLLGVDEGAAGMTDVDSTTVRGKAALSLSANGDDLRFDANLGVHALALNDRRLAPDVVRGIDAALVARGSLDDKGALVLDDGELAVGAIRVTARGTIEQNARHTAASLTVDVPVTGCQSLFESIPSALIPSLAASGITGTFGVHARAAFDSTNLDAAVLDWTTDDRCAMSTVPEELARERFSQPFDHVIYLPDGTLDTQTTGPTSENWSDLEHISPFMQVAVLTTEDGAFFRHHGFNHAAIRNALVADLKAGRFVRGASTITMQLAKNLFLTREKNLSRKLEELILADYLEGAFTKQELMGLYLNVIEFGPNVYGITQAAHHYFGRAPAELNLAECLFLSSLLPSPVRLHKLAEKPLLSDAWSKRLRDLMQIAAKLGTISPRELEEGLHEQVAFHGENDPLPPPRPPVTGTLFQSTMAPGVDAWQVVP